MANYATHIGAGTVVSGALATLTLAANVVSPENLVAVTLACVLGSVLPDIDLKDSRASRLLFSSMAVFVSFCVLFVAAPNYSIVELWILWLGSLVFVRYGLQAMFHRMSVHRGVWHSVLAAVLWSAVTAIVFKYVLGMHEGVAWLGAGFMFIGYLVHLILDEIYSVDFMGRRIKRSFGTALKLIDTKHPARTAAMALVTAVAIYATPPTAEFVNGISSQNLWTGLHNRFLPEDKWFGIIPASDRVTQATDTQSNTAPKTNTSGNTQGSSGLTTGSVPDRAPAE